jgi:hypothetical protein
MLDTLLLCCPVVMMHRPHIHAALGPLSVKQMMQHEAEKEQITD